MLKFTMSQDVKLLQKLNRWPNYPHTICLVAKHLECKQTFTRVIKEAICIAGSKAEFNCSCTLYNIAVRLHVHVLSMFKRPF